MSQRARVLSLYRSILRLGRNWTSAEGPQQTKEQRDYILREARELFRKNKQLSDPAEIDLRIQEAQARVDIAVHYENPYPRPVYTPPDTYAAATDKRKRDKYQKKLNEGKPIYTQSIK
uniref:Complex 1 LYR protein domain-containing protein n=1 Tax=Plectus sambesii TaxID=2011161 RepID=A0A914WID5_9BILA